MAKLSYHVHETSNGGHDLFLWQLVIICTSSNILITLQLYIYLLGFRQLKG